MIKPLTIAIAAMAIGAPASFGQSSLDAASASAQAKLDDALKRLSALRAEIGSEKIPLAKERDSVFEKLREVRRQADRVQRLSDNQSSDLAAFEAELKAQQEVVDYLINLSAEFSRSLGSQLDPSEVSRYDPMIGAAQEASEDPGLDAIGKIAAQGAALKAGIARMESLSGGASYPGKAVLPSGLVVDGRFVRFGPVTFFAGDSGAAGLSVRGASLDPAVATIADGKFDQAIQELANGSIAEVPLDATLSNAMAIAATKETLMEHIQKGGIWIYPILMFAGLSLAVAAFKAFEIFMLPKPKPGVMGDLLSSLADGERDKAAAVAGSTPGPAGKMLQQGVKYCDHDPELVEEIMYETIVETQPKVMRLLPFISVTAAVAPLLGLLGTVTGMINTFNRIKIFGTGDAKSLSGGISEALITTEFGLIVAIPALLLYAILSRKAKAYLSKMEKMSISFINGLKTMKESGVEVNGAAVMVGSPRAAPVESLRS